jgi:hypothetical protein
MTEAQPIKTRKRQTLKPSTQQPSKKGTTLYLSNEAIERLVIHAMKAGMDRSAFVEDLINKNCRQFVLHNRGGSDANPDNNNSAI